ncbi:hypothetical protein NPIL_377151, partial [Nephila pilipes]
MIRPGILGRKDPSPSSLILLPSPLKDFGWRDADITIERHLVAIVKAAKGKVLCFGE